MPGAVGSMQPLAAAVERRVRGAAAGGPSAREILLWEQPELLEQFSNDLFPVLVQVLIKY
jgi:hypothetical protein